MTVVLIGPHGRVLSARAETRAAVDAFTVNGTEEFDFVDLGAGTFALRTITGKYLSALPEHRVESGIDQLREWEVFRLVRAREGRFGILTHHRSFFSAEPDGKLTLEQRLREWEEFYLWITPTADAFDAANASGPAIGRAPLSAGELLEYCRAHAAESEKTALELVHGVVLDADAAPLPR